MISKRAKMIKKIRLLLNLLTYPTIYLGIYLSGFYDDFLPKMISGVPASILLAVVLADWNIMRIRINLHRLATKEFLRKPLDVKFDIPPGKMTLAQYEMKKPIEEAIHAGYEACRELAREINKIL